MPTQREKHSRAGTDTLSAADGTVRRDRPPPGAFRILVVTGLIGALLTAPASAGHKHLRQGPEGRPAQQLATKAITNFERRNSVHMRLTTDSLRLDLTLDRRGNCTGKAETAGQGALEFVKQGRTVWLKPDTEFWKSRMGSDRGAAVAAYADGRYVKGTADDAAMGGMSATCDLRTLHRSVAAATGEAEDPGAWRTDDRDEHTVSVSRESSGGAKATMVVSAQGRPCPVELTRTAGGNTETLQLGRLGEPVPDRTPPDSHSLEVAELERAVNSGADGSDPVRSI